MLEAKSPLKGVHRCPTNRPRESDAQATTARGWDMIGCVGWYRRGSGPWQAVLAAASKRDAQVALATYSAAVAAPRFQLAVLAVGKHPPELLKGGLAR